MAPELREDSATRALNKPDLSLKHLEAELARIDVLLKREVRRWILANQDPADAFRGLYVSDAQAEALLARPLAASWGQTVALSPSEAHMFAEGKWSWRKRRSLSHFGNILIIS